MPYVRRNLGQRLQYKAPLVQRAVRDRQRRNPNSRAAKEQNVYINYSRTFFLFALAAHLLLKIQNARDQLPWHFFRIQLDSAVQEPRLRSHLNWFGFIEGRNAYHLS